MQRGDYIRHVLVLEDNKADMLYLQRKLPEWGYTADYAWCCDEFEGLLKNEFYAAILDNQLPDIPGGRIESDRGMQLAFRLKEERPEARLILHTTGLDRKKISELEQAGIEYVVKGEYERLREVLEI